MLILIRLAIFAVFAISASAAFAAEVPDWMRQAASAGIPNYEKTVSAVVLHDEQQVTLDAQGRLVTIENYAVKLLASEGRKYAIARAYYLVSSGKVREIEGW